MIGEIVETVVVCVWLASPLLLELWDLARGGGR